MTTIKEIAEELDGAEFLDYLDSPDKKRIADMGIVVVFDWAGDVNFDGAMSSEIECDENGTVYFNQSGALWFEAGDERSQSTEHASKIKVMDGHDGYEWAFETDIPHETFSTIEYGEKYCRGMVFLLADVAEVQ